MENFGLLNPTDLADYYLKGYEVELWLTDKYKVTRIDIKSHLESGNDVGGENLAVYAYEQCKVYRGDRFYLYRDNTVVVINETKVLPERTDTTIKCLPLTVDVTGEAICHESYIPCHIIESMDYGEDCDLMTGEIKGSFFNILSGGNREGAIILSGSYYVEDDTIAILEKAASGRLPLYYQTRVSPYIEISSPRKTYKPTLGPFCRQGQLVIERITYETSSTNLTQIEIEAFLSNAPVPTDFVYYCPLPQPSLRYCPFLTPSYVIDYEVTLEEAVNISGYCPLSPLLVDYDISYVFTEVLPIPAGDYCPTDIHAMKTYSTYDANLANRSGTWNNDNSKTFGVFGYINFGGGSFTFTVPVTIGVSYDFYLAYPEDIANADASLVISDGVATITDNITQKQPPIDLGAESARWRRLTADFVPQSTSVSITLTHTDSAGFRLRLDGLLVLDNTNTYDAYTFGASP
jgi:hypothetical protein